MPALGNYNPFAISYRDYSGETKSIRMYTGAITEITLPDLLADLGDLETALDAVTLGVRAKQSWGEESILSNARAATKDAQVETELLVRFQGATTQKPFSLRIPTADYTAFNYANPPAGDQVILSGAGATAATTALVAAMQAVLRSPDDNTEGIVITGIEVVR